MALPKITNSHQPDQPQHSSSNASISVRDYIYILPHPLPQGTPIPYTPGLPDRNPLHYPPHPFEPTSTLVLTSPARTFVDVRVLKPVKKGEELEHGLPNIGGPKERLEWAFAGTSRSVEIEDPFGLAIGGPYPPNSTTRTFAGPVTAASWSHWIDSKFPVGTPASQIPEDEGTMFPLTEERTLEFGSSTNPATGKTTAYEECWTDLDIASTTGDGVKTCVVLCLDATAAGTRGVVIRLGGWCQGILVQGRDVTVERWEYVEGEAGGEGEWKRRVRIGDLFLPCGIACKAENMKVGGLVNFSGYQWRVEEVADWTEVET